MTFSCALLKRIDNKCDNGRTIQNYEGTKHSKSQSCPSGKCFFSIETDANGRVSSFDIRSADLYDHLAYDLFHYELLFTKFCRTIICPIRSFAYEHLLTNPRHKIIYPVTILHIIAIQWENLIVRVGYAPTKTTNNKQTNALWQFENKFA